MGWQIRRTIKLGRDYSTVDDRSKRKCYWTRASCDCWRLQIGDVTHEVEFLSNDYNKPNTNPDHHDACPYPSRPSRCFESSCAPVFCDFVRNYSCTVGGAVVTSIKLTIKNFKSIDPFIRNDQLTSMTPRTLKIAVMITPIQVPKCCTKASLQAEKKLILMSMNIGEQNKENYGKFPLKIWFKQLNIRLDPSLWSANRRLLVA